MGRMGTWTKGLLAPAALLMTLVGVHAAQPVTIPVVLPLTGGAAFLGQGERTALQLVEKVVNANGGVSGAGAIRLP